MELLCEEIMRLPNQFNVMLVKDKKPLASWKHLTERRQTAEEQAAVLQAGANGSIGIITGEVSRLFVLDIDGPEGEKSIEGLHIPRTWTVKTPRGWHYYFRWTPELAGRVTTRAGVRPNVDTRGDGGYVVWYGWKVAPEVAPLAAPPQWLIDLLPRAADSGGQGRPSVGARLADIKEGSRNQSFTSLAGSLRSRGYSVEEIYAFLEPKAKEVGFPLGELQSVCTSIGRYLPSDVVSTLRQSESKGESVESFLRESEPVKWICKPFVAEQSIGIIGGLPESRKSWVMVDLAIEVARGGGMWLNKFPVKSGRVLLIDQERSKAEVQRRLKALLAGKGLSAADMRSALFVRSGTTSRINLDPSFEALKRELGEIKPDLVLIDSFATIHTAEESNRMEIQKVLERMKQLRNEFGCAIIFVHHSTKQSYQSQKEGAEPSYLDLAGNVAIPAAAEMCLSVVKHDGESSFVHHTKSTQGSKEPPFLVRVKDAEPDQSKIVVEAF